MKIGLIGFGSMGKTHSWCVNNLKYFYRDLHFSAEYAGVCTSKLESAENAARFLGIDRYTVNEDELINDESIDIIDICTPNIYHYETLKKAIAAKKHVYCEKPLCITYEQAKEIAELAEKAGVTAQIVFNNRFLPAIMRAKELIEEGRLGRILSFRCEYLHSSAADPNKKAGWKQNKDICGAGTLFDLGSHAVDLIYYLCGEIVSVKGQSQIAYPVRLGLDGKEWHTNADEAFYMICKTAGGAVGTIEASKVAVGSNDDINLAVYGEKGSIKFSLMEPNWLMFYDATAEDGNYGGCKGYTRIECCGRYLQPGGIFPSFKAPIGWLRGHMHSMYSFLDACHNGKSATPSLTDGAHVQKVLQMALESDN
ncbi:MAG: Gfo/Idh/MocA family oxidoreductase [Ruminococcaceae bacterium]|nr:Gfo/Idh/MocA family oxidoreductase [Oscillospiraceae bacterium]